MGIIYCFLSKIKSILFKKQLKIWNQFREKQLVFIHFLKTKENIDLFNYVFWNLFLKIIFKLKNKKYLKKKNIVK